MRGAGCIVNDIADRKIDREVERTKSRPLASGEVSLKEAVLLTVSLCAASSLIALYLGIFLIALLWLPLIIAYPWMKRLTWWPQLFLGLTFNAGALFGWVAITGETGMVALVLYAGCIAWTLGYDTIYAHQDKEDDARIGVKSTALRLGNQTKASVAMWYGAFVFCLFSVGVQMEVQWWFYPLLLLPAAHLFWQVATADLDSPESCMKRFVSNQYLSPIIAGILLISV